MSKNPDSDPNQSLVGLHLELHPTLTLGRAETCMAHLSTTSPGLTMRLPGLSVADAQNAEQGDIADVDFVVLERLGEGGMGIVELAHQPVLERQVALKRLKPGNRGTTQVLLDEARILSRLEHPNIIPVHAVGNAGVLGPVVVMKRVQGETWSERLERERAGLEGGVNDVFLARHLDILLNVCNAVHFAHNRGVIHRDLKTSNVMLGAFGEIYVVDWGVAWVSLLDAPDTRTPNIVGTPCYMPPEMFHDLRIGVDVRSDVYLLGTVLHEILTGEPRHHGDTVIEVVQQAEASEPAVYSTEIPSELAEVCNLACNRELDRRYPTARAFQQALIEFLERRDAHRIEAAASARMSASEQAIREQADDADIQRLFNEAHFGFNQALALKDLPAARDGRRALLTSMFEYECSRGNVHGAERVLELLDDRPDALLERIKGLRAEHAAAQARLAYLEQEVDTTVALPERLRVVVGLLALFSALNLTSFISNPSLEVGLSTRGLFLFNVVATGLVVVMVAVWRKKVFSTTFGRRFMRLVLVLVVADLLNRAMGWIGDMRPVDVVRNDIFIIGLGFLMVRLPLRSGFGIGVALTLTALLLSVWPLGTRVAHYATLTLVPVVIALELVLRARAGGATASDVREQDRNRL